MEYRRSAQSTSPILLQEYRSFTCFTFIKRSLIKTVITKVIWVPSFAEFESRKPPEWANRRSHGLRATEKLDVFNRLLYDQLRNRLVDRTSLTYGFFDLVRVSVERESWSLDGIHMDPQWYRLIMSYLLQVYCGRDIILAS